MGWFIRVSKVDALIKGKQDIAGNNILIYDKEQDIIISEVKSMRYRGKVALVGDPARVFLGVLDFPDGDNKILDYLSAYNAVLGINAGGFVKKTGEVLGLVASQGVLTRGVDAELTTIAFTDKHELFVCNITEADWINLKVRDGVQFKPVLVYRGRRINHNVTKWGIHPRTVVGQRKNGVVIFLVIDGRQIGYSLGATLDDCIDIMLSYGAYMAGNCDGGSSSVMAYNNRIITRPSSDKETGISLPNAFLVKRL